MPNYSQSSQDKLATCHPSLQKVFNLVIQAFDNIILCGHRPKAEQDRVFTLGQSKVQWPNGAHNSTPSRAADAAPYPLPQNWGAVSWELIPEEHREKLKKEIKELHKFYYFSGYVGGVASALGIELRSGCDWDGDKQFNDQTFDDLVHFEMV